MFYAIKTWKRSLPLALLVALVGSYPLLRGTGALDAEAVKSAAAIVFDEQRVESLGVRLRSEDLYIEHAAERWLLGWGGYGRGEVFVDGTRSIPDGLWVIALSRAGWLAVFSLAALYLIPPTLLVRRHRAAIWTQPDFAPIAALNVLLVLYWVDCLSNAMVTPVLVVAIGAAQGWFAERRSFTTDVATSASPMIRPSPIERAPSLARALRRLRK
jgi:hypothetical protein